MFHSCSLYTESAGIRICEDTTAIVGPDIMDEFAMPYSRRLASRFGGAWVHYCGRISKPQSKVLSTVLETRLVFRESPAITTS